MTGHTENTERTTRTNGFSRRDSERCKPSNEFAVDGLIRSIKYGAGTGAYRTSGNERNDIEGSEETMSSGE